MQNNLITPNLVDRLKGVVTFKAPVYKSIAEDTTATNNAAIIVIVTSVVAGIIGGAIISAMGAGNFIGFLIRSVVSGLIGWVAASWVTAFVAKTFFKGDTNTSEMMRVFGFSSIFGILAIIPGIGGIIGAVLSAIGSVLGIREAASLDNTKAIITAVIAFVVIFVISAILNLIIR